MEEKTQTLTSLALAPFSKWCFIKLRISHICQIIYEMALAPPKKILSKKTESEFGQAKACQIDPYSIMPIQQDKDCYCASIKSI